MNQHNLSSFTAKSGNPPPLLRLLMDLPSGVGLNTVSAHSTKATHSFGLAIGEAPIFSSLWSIQM